VHRAKAGGPGCHRTAEQTKEEKKPRKRRERDRVKNKKAAKVVRLRQGTVGWQCGVVRYEVIGETR